VHRAHADPRWPKTRWTLYDVENPCTTCRTCTTVTPRSHDGQAGVSQVVPAPPCRSGCLRAAVRAQRRRLEREAAAHRTRQSFLAPRAAGRAPRRTALPGRAGPTGRARARGLRGVRRRAGGRAGGIGDHGGPRPHATPLGRWGKVPRPAPFERFTGCSSPRDLRDRHRRREVIAGPDGRTQRVERSAGHDGRPTRRRRGKGTRPGAASGGHGRGRIDR